jgi:hypothetical protein
MKILTSLCDLGYEIELEGDVIVCRWRGPGEPEAIYIRPLIEQLNEHKAEAKDWLRHDWDLPVEIAEWPAEWRERYEERAAIIEYDAGKSRAEAEVLADELVRNAHRLTRGATA